MPPPAGPPQFTHLASSTEPCNKNCGVWALSSFTMTVGPPLPLRYSFRCSSLAAPLQLRYRSATAPLQSSCCFRCAGGSVTASVTALLQPLAPRCSPPVWLRYSSKTYPLQLRYVPFQFRLSAPLPARSRKHFCHSRGLKMPVEPRRRSLGIQPLWARLAGPSYVQCENLLGPQP